jgi:hypothetical protein
MGLNKRVLAFLIAAFAFTGSAAFAQSMESTPAPKPAKPNFAAMKFMVGTWACSIKSSRRPAAYELTTTYALDPTGYWLIGKSTTKAMAWFPYAAASDDHITYDADTGRWIDVTTGDFGGYDLQSSKGWTGNTLVWHDLAVAPGKDVTSQADITVTKVSDTKTTSQSTFTTVKGRTVSVAGACTKQS